MKDGRDCLPWETQGGDPTYNYMKDQNYCRNPGSPSRRAWSVFGVWCYYGETDDSWGYCPVKKCSECDKGIVLLIYHRQSIILLLGVGG